MKNKLRMSFLVSLIFSVLFYAIPFEFGGNIIRWTVILISIGLFILTLLIARKFVPTRKLFSFSILLINLIAILHFVLIFATIVIELSHLCISAIGLLAILFIMQFANRRLKNFE